MQTTSIYLRRELLEAVDRRAIGLGMSRTGLIRLILERAIENREGWSPGFITLLRDIPQNPEQEAAIGRALGE